MVRRDVFDKLSGFDEVFSPAYYEDTDLCMRIWESGYRVVYDPYAVATHVEYAGSSFDTARKLMEERRPILVMRHRDALESHATFSERNLFRARDRRPAPAILILDDCVPIPDEGSGYP